MEFLDFLEKTFNGVTVQNWLIALGISILTIILLQIIKRIIVGRLTRLAKKTTTDVDDFLVESIDRTNALFLLSIAIFAATLYLHLPLIVTDIVGDIVLIALLIQAAIWLSGFITFFTQRKVRAQVEEAAASATTFSAFGLIAKTVLWSIVILLVLENVTGLQVDSLIASLGITGIAVALAVQNILGDLFASLSIAMDQPFVIGDFIIVGDFLGSVEHIGLKSTRVRSLSGEQLVFSNSDLLNSRIRNFKRMARRRVVFSIGVTYDTPYEKLAVIPEKIEKIIVDQPDVTFDRAHFQGYGDFSLKFEIVYYVETPDYNEYMDHQQEINLAVYKLFEEEGIEFAFPTQTLYVKEETANLSPKLS